MASNITHLTMEEGKVRWCTKALTQYDYGQRLVIDGIQLPSNYEVFFSNSERSEATTSIGDSTGVDIPDWVLESGECIFIWVFLHTGAEDGETVATGVIRVNPRSKTANEPPTPQQLDVISQLMAALNVSVAEAQALAAGIPVQIRTALQEAKDSGEFNGPKGDTGAVFTPSVNDGVMTWTNNGGLPNPEPTNFVQELGLNQYATKQEVSGKIDSGLIGSPNGVAGLDASGRIPSEQLPSYVDDVLEYPSFADFPNQGEAGKIYIDLSNNYQYRWSGSQYINITGGDLDSRKADKRDTVLETTLSRGRQANTVSGAGSIAFGSSVTASGQYSTALGSMTAATGDSAVAEGALTTAEGDYSHAEGYSTYAKGRYSHTENQYSKATGTASHAEGYYSEASGDNSHAEGSGSKAANGAAHAEGTSTRANGQSSHTEGIATTTYSQGAHAEGYSTIASSDFSHAEGYGGEFTNGESTWQSGAYGVGSHSEGTKTRAQGDGAHSEGRFTVANAPGAHAEGVGTKAIGYGGSHAEGDGTQALQDSSHAEGKQTQAGEDAAHAEGSQTIASGISSHAEGSGTRATGSYSHAEGGGTQATANGSHAEGGGSQATADNAHAEGSGTRATGSVSHAEGSGSTASGYGSHAEGGGTTASGSMSHAEGTGTTASNSTSHAEGAGTQATGANSHAEGSGSRAIGPSSHAEGSGSAASAYSSHVEGGGSTASGEFAHAQNQATIASGKGSHAEGYATVARGAYSHVSGIQNIEDSYDNWTEWTPGEHCVPGDKRKRTQTVDEETIVEGFVCKTENMDAEWDKTHWFDLYGQMNYAVIIGNGYHDPNDQYNYIKSNAYTLDWDGTARLMGDVYVRCNPDGTGGTKLGAPVVDDVRINGSSILQNGIANIPLADGNNPGVVKTNMTYGFSMVNGCIALSKATDAQIKAGNNSSTASNYRAITPGNLKPAVFYGLADSAGDSTQKNSSNAVGTYTDEAKQAIQKMLGLDGILGDFESSAVASKAYAIGETFVYNGKRYRATTAISISDVIAPGTNCTLDPIDGRYVKKTDYASGDNPGVARIDSNYGISIILSGTGEGKLRTYVASDEQIQTGLNSYRPLTPSVQHKSVFYGLSKVAGVDLNGETITLGTYPATAKAAIQNMLGVPVASDEDAMEIITQYPKTWEVSA